MRISKAVPLQVLLTLGLVLGPSSVEAQSGDGFLFGRPSVMLTAHGGLSRPEASSDLFSFVTELFTLERSDFDALAGGATVRVPVNDRVAIGLSGLYTSRTSGSEYRDFVDQDDLPIEQRTSFTRIPLLASARMYLSPPGESVGTLAWIPNTWAPYVGVGGGAMWHRFRIEGDLIDYQDNSVFSGDVEDSGWSGAVQILGGADYNLSTRLFLTGELGYVWSNADAGLNLLDLEDPIDLSGASATLGISVRL